MVARFQELDEKKELSRRIDVSAISSMELNVITNTMFTVSQQKCCRSTVKEKDPIQIELKNMCNGSGNLHGTNLFLKTYPLWDLRPP